MSALLLGAALSAGASLFSGMAAKNSAMKQMALQAENDAENIKRQSLNTMIRNAYSAAFAQMQLGQERMNRAMIGSEIRTAGLVQRGVAAVAATSTNTIGASVDAVLSDIQMNVDDALAQNSQEYEKAIDQYNYQLEMMKTGTEMSQPVMRKYEYTGPSDTGLLLSSLGQGGMYFGSTYLMKNMQIGLGN